MEIKIQYTGRRIVNDRLAQSFLQDGEEVYFGKLKSLTVGEWYLATIGEGDNLSIRSRPEWTVGPDPSEEDLKKWEAEDLLARQEMGRRTFAAKMEKHTAIVECAARLKPLMRGLGFSQKKQIVDFIMEELEKEERENFRKSLQKASDRLKKHLEKKLKRANDRLDAKSKKPRSKSVV